MSTLKEECMGMQGVIVGAMFSVWGGGNAIG